MNEEVLSAECGFGTEELLYKNVLQFLIVLIAQRSALSTSESLSTQHFIFLLDI
jgi:hypothetical protein